MLGLSELGAQSLSDTATRILGRVAVYITLIPNLTTQ